MQLLWTQNYWLIHFNNIPFRDTRKTAACEAQEILICVPCFQSVFSLYAYKLIILFGHRYFIYCPQNYPVKERRWFLQCAAHNHLSLLCNRRSACKELGGKAEKIPLALAKKDCESSIFISCFNIILKFKVFP